MEDLLHTEILSDKVMSKPWGRSRGNPTFKTRVKRRTRRRAQRDQSVSTGEQKLLADALCPESTCWTRQCGDSPECCGCSRTARCRYGGRRPDTAKGHQATLHQDAHPGMFIPGNAAGNATAARTAARQAPSGGTPQHQISQQRGKGSARERTEGGGAGGRAPGGCARAGGLIWGGARGRPRAAAVQTASHIPAGPRFLY